MDSKGTEEEITYPNIFFTVDNFEEVGSHPCRNASLALFHIVFVVDYVN
jgi:hypothetical protein